MLIDDFSLKDRAGILYLNNVGATFYITISALHLIFVIYFFSVVVNQKTNLKVSKQAFYGK